MNTNGNLPAMPCEVVEQYHIDASQVSVGAPTLRERKVMGGGMTKREEFALKIMAAIYSNPAMIDDLSESSSKVVASAAVKAADALLEELERTK